MLSIREVARSCKKVFKYIYMPGLGHLRWWKQRPGTDCSNPLETLDILLSGSVWWGLILFSGPIGSKHVKRLRWWFIFASAPGLPTSLSTYLPTFVSACFGLPPFRLLRWVPRRIIPSGMHHADFRNSMIEMEIRIRNTKLGSQTRELGVELAHRPIHLPLQRMCERVPPANSVKSIEIIN